MWGLAYELFEKSMADSKINRAINNLIEDCHRAAEYGRFVIGKYYDLESFTGGEVEEITEYFRSKSSSVEIRCERKNRLYISWYTPSNTHLNRG